MPVNTAQLLNQHFLNKGISLTCSVCGGNRWGASPPVALAGYEQNVFGLGLLGGTLEGTLPEAQVGTFRQYERHCYAVVIPTHRLSLDRDAMFRRLFERAASLQRERDRLTGFPALVSEQIGTGGADVPDSVLMGDGTVPVVGC